jgi:2-oxoglutarate dehydrogenase E2 component (dihydrolipoamide succinyltransferase)
MSVPVELPELGESVVEGTVARWLVKEGDHVELDQPVVDVGTVLARINPAAEAGATPSRTAEEAPVAASPRPVAAAAPPPQSSAGARPTPVATQMANESGVDLTGMTGSGVGGRITKHDVAEQAARLAEPRPEPVRPAARPAPAAAPEAPRQERRVAAASAPEKPQKRLPFASVDLEEGDRVIPMTPIRRLVAEHMVYSKRTSPHVGTVAEIDLGGVVASRAAHKKKFQETHGVALTFLPFIVHATVRALRENPRLNASVIEDAIVEKRDLNIGIAVETEKGLVVPVVRHADSLSLSGLAAAIEDLSSRARTKKLTADDLKGGTFTVSNPGRNGNLYGFAIINQPQVGILRMGEIVKRPVVRTVDGSDAIVIRPMMHLALSYDHRAVDGSPANAFLFRVREILEEADFDL